MGKRIWMVLIAVLFLLVTVGSAMALFSSKSYDDNTGIVTIKDWLGLDEVVTLELVSNTDYCLENCKALIKVMPDNNIKDLKDSWKFYMKSGRESGDVYDYNVELLNDKKEHISNSVKNLTKGNTYYIELIAVKHKWATVEWSLSVLDFEITEWNTLWSNIKIDESATTISSSSFLSRLSTAEITKDNMTVLKEKVEFKEKEIILEEIEKKNCFEYNEEQICFETNIDSQFYYKEIDEGIKFGWKVNNSKEATKFIITSNINLNSLEGLQIDWSDFDEAGLDYIIVDNVVTIKNPNATEWWFDPIITTHLTNAATGYTNQRHIVETSGGNIYVLIRNKTSQGDELFKSTDSGDTWTSMFNITETGAYFYSNSMVIDSSDNLHIIYSVYRADSQRDIDYLEWNVSDDTPIGNITIVDAVNGTTDASYPDIAILDNGTIGVIYRHEDGSIGDLDDIAFKNCSSDCTNAASWSGETIVCDASDWGDKEQNSPDLETNGTEWFATWYGKNGTYPTSNQIFYASTTLGSWQTPEAIGGYDSRGHFNPSLIVWNNIPHIAIDSQMAGPIYDIYYSNRSGGSWQNWSIVIESNKVQYRPTLSHNTSHLFIAWEAINITGNYDNCTGITISPDNGTTWSSPVCNSTPPGQRTHYPSLSYQYGHADDWDIHLIYTQKINATDYNVTYQLLWDAPPTVSVTATLVSPVNETVSTIGNITFVCNSTAVGTTLENVTLFIYNESGNIWSQNKTDISGTTNLTNWTITNIPEKNFYNWTCQVWDSSDTYNHTAVNRTFNVTYPNPSIEFIDEIMINNTGYNRDWINVTVSANETLHGLKNITIYLYNSTDGSDLFMTNTSIVSSYSINYTNLDDGDYYINATAYSNQDKSNSTGTLNITLDTAIPTLTIDVPIDGDSTSYYNTTVGWNISLNYSAYDTDGLDTCWYETSWGVDAILAACANATLNLTTFGWQWVVVYVNDSANNVASDNNTFLVNEMGAWNNTYYNSTTLETWVETFRLMVNATNITNSTTNANFTWNGTIHQVNYSYSNGTTKNFTVVYRMPFINTSPSDDIDYLNATIPLYWNYTLNNISYSTASVNQTIIKFLLTNKSNLALGNKTLNMSLLDEDTDAAINGTINLDLRYYLTNVARSDLYRNSSYNFVDKFSGVLYVYPYWANITTNATTYFESLRPTGTNYSGRYHYLHNANLSNTTTNITLKLLRDDDAVKFFFTVKEGIDYVKNGFVIIQKYYVGEGVYKKVSERETDDFGGFIDYMDLDKKYQFIVYDSNHTLIGSTTRAASCKAAPCEMTLQVGEQETNIWEAYSDMYGGDVDYSWDYNTTSNIVTYTFADTRGTSTYSRLQVNIIKYNQSSLMVCNTSLYDTSGAIECNLSGYTGEFLAKAYVSRSPESLISAWRHIIESLREIFGSEGVLLGLLLIITVGFVGIHSPVIGITLLTIGMLALQLIGIVSFTFGVIILLAGWGIFFIIKGGAT